MTIDDEAMAEQRLLAAVAAVRVAVDSSAPSRPSEHGSPASDEWMIVLEQPAVEQETRNHSAHWALSGIAALLVAGLAGILLVIGRPTPTVVEPGGAHPSGHSSPTGIQPATTVPPKARPHSPSQPRTSPTSGTRSALISPQNTP